MNNKELPPLPEGWTVEYDSCIGYSFSYKGRIRIYHPVDDEAIRRLIWVHHKKMEKQ